MENFRKGDFVKVVNTSDRSMFPKGAIVKVIETFPTDCMYCKGVDKYDNEDFWYVRKSDVEPAIIKRELHITSDGFVTNCVYKVNGKIEKRSKATRNTKEDDFDMRIGADLCLDRIFGEKPKEEKYAWVTGKDLIGKTIPKGTKVKVLNANDHLDGSYIGLEFYKDQLGITNDKSTFVKNGLNGYLGASITFDNPAINLIDKNNGNFFWSAKEVAYWLRVE